MSETVKKSRIVSDEENLEESLLEEFNMRLKNCMSNDKINNDDEEEEEEKAAAGDAKELAEEEEGDQILENSVYENVETLTLPPVKQCGVSSSDFIQSEKEHYYEEPNLLLKNGDGAASPPNGHENIYEHVTETEKTECKLNDQYIDMEDQPVIVKPTINLENNDYELMGENNYEVVCDKPSGSVSPSSNDGDNKSSVKDRMFLSTDDTSCLLFTQTVTSPMLTPSEENIDFLKGFRRESTKDTSSGTPTSASPKNDKIVDEDVSDPIVTDLDDDKVYENSETTKEVIYENLPNGKVHEEVIYENVQTVAKIPEIVEETNDAIYQNLEDLKIEKEMNDLNKNRESLTEFESLEKALEDLQEDKEKSIEEIVESVQENIEEDTEKTVSTVVKSEVKEKYSEFIHHNRIETSQNYLEKYSEVVSKSSKTIESKENDTETVPDKIVANLKSQFSKNSAEVIATTKKEIVEVNKLKNLDIMKQINKFEQQKDSDEEEFEESTVTESYTETSTTYHEMGQIEDKGLKKKKSKKSRKEEKENISVNENDRESAENFYNVNVKNLCRSFGDLTKIDNETFLTSRKLKQMSKERGKSSFNKFDALQKKNVLHVRSSDAAGAQDKFNGNQIDTSNCKACGKTVFQMEQVKAERAIWHRNCFRCIECNKQLTVDTYESHEGNLYCKPHFKLLFAPKAVEEDDTPKLRKHELIIRENQPLELPPGVVRASDKPDLGLEELQSLNVKERFQVFEHHQQESHEIEREPINVKRSPSILSKLARFQAKGMDVGVADDSLNGIPIEESSSEEEEVEEEVDGDDADLVRAKKVQKEKPFHFTAMNDVKNRWEKGEQNAKDERREERKQEIQSIRNRLFMGKQGKMKEMYQQAVMQSESTTNMKNSEKIDFDAKSIKDKFEKGELINDKVQRERDDEEEVFESEISKKSRSLFLELDANASKPPQISPVTPPRVEIKKAREAYLKQISTDDTVRSSEIVDDVEVKTADIQQRFKFFETYKEPEKQRKQFRITPPREGQVKAPTPEREVYRDPEVVRSEEFVEDSVIAKETHTATKMLNKFRQMEENLSKEPVPSGPKPLKRFTPPPEPARAESSSEGESGSEEESEQEEDQLDNSRLPEDLLEAQKAARAKHLRAKFEKWEANEIKREQTNSVNIVEEIGDEQSQIESTRSLRARFENMRETSTETKSPRVKVHRFV